MSETITLKNPLDMHIHLREGDILKAVAPCSASAFSAVLAMPNLKKPIATTKMALDYKNEILNATKNANFLPIMSLYLTPNLTKDELILAKQNNIKILKLYPKGATTGSENGVDNILDKNSQKHCNSKGELHKCKQFCCSCAQAHGHTRGECRSHPRICGTC